MKRLHRFTLALIFTTNGMGLSAPLEVTHLKCEYKVNPLGIDVLQPRLSWQLRSTERGVIQKAYQLRAAATPEDLKAGRNLLWAPDKVPGEQSVHVSYGGPALTSRQRVAWQVRVWDNQGHRSAWSQPATWEMGLLQARDWQAQWITPELREAKDQSNPCPMLREEFHLEAPIVAARAYVTCHGLYEFSLNGQRVGDELFTPGWTAYDHRLQYQTYDVTAQLKQGANAVGVILGDGWHRGRLMWGDKRNLYGETLDLLAQIVVTYGDGSEQWIVTNGSWKAATGPILASDIYNGETYDARMEKENWNRVGYDDGAWQGVKVVPADSARLVAPLGVPVQRIEEIKPLALLRTPEGETVLDMGQNMVGWCRIRVQGPAGTRITLRHAEVLDKEGNFYTENLRAAQQTNTYILKGKGVEEFEPHFTFQGFRYVAVEGWPGELRTDDVVGVVIHSRIRPSGTFTCSNDMINQLQHNIQWGQKGNFLDVPTDCPQRDERLGWTGDCQAFARTACFNADCAAFYTRWLADLAADQKRSGAVPHVIPDTLTYGQENGGASAGWADAATIVPWTVYLCYGDRDILEAQYPSMKAWVEYMARRAGDSYFWHQDFTFGDWLSFNTTRSDYPGATTDKDLITQAFFAHSTDLLVRTARVLGKMEEARIYALLLDNIKRVFQDEFLTPNGRLASHTQTAYTLALSFDLLPEDMREKAAARLADDVRKFKHITTGFLGTPDICHVLSDYGYFDEAFMLLNRKEYPSWLYPVTRGATTIWERWDGIKPDGSFQDVGMNSYNHYAYGAIGDWLYRVVAGLELDATQPGYKHVRIQPHPGGDLSFARATLETPYGPAASGWRIEGKTITVDVTVPVNTTATVRLPQAAREEVREGAQRVKEARQVQDAVVIDVGSGTYRFTYPIQS